jgi:hypothetical protein
MVSKRLAGALALCLLASAPGGRPASTAGPLGAEATGKDLPTPPVFARLAVHAGRATLVQGEAIAILTRVSARRDVRGEAYVEIGVLGELELAWPGAASLRVSGPAALEWGPSGDLRVLRAARLELEVRRGVRAVDLPGGWAVDVGRGAIGAAERATGDWLVENRGGADVAVRRDGDAAGAIASGGRALLRVLR